MDPNNQFNQQPNSASGQLPYGQYTMANQPMAAQPGFAPNNTPQTPGGQIAPVKTNPNSTQNTLLISEIRDGIVIMNDGSFQKCCYAQKYQF
jgi:hypothetical protein